jgi:hypothetical protein
MNILDAILNTTNDAAVRQAGAVVGLGQDQTAAALAALVPRASSAIPARRMVWPDWLAPCRAATTSGISTTR